MRLSGKHAIVTGAGSGIGRASAVALRNLSGICCPILPNMAATPPALGILKVTPLMDQPAQALLRLWFATGPGPLPYT